MSRPKALLSWSSGKDAAWSLHQARLAGEYDVVGLLTTMNETADRVAMHAVRRVLLERQAAAAGLPLHTVDLPSPCTNVVYKERVGNAFLALKESLGITHVLFGDLHLEDVRGYREQQMESLGLTPVFPIFGLPTAQLARDMIAGGLRATITCVDTKQLDASFSGRAFDRQLLADLPEGVDHCGENGEFHTLVTAGPMFSGEIVITPGDAHEAGQFLFQDFLPEA